MDCIEHLATRPERIIHYILEAHKAWHEGRFEWITSNYEELKKLSPIELVEALNKELNNG